jgi:sugar phosphate isomerase/epimerase
VIDCPIGEGMVDWKTFAVEMRKARFSGPISLHIEYEPGGRTPVEKREKMLEAAVRDRRRLVALLTEGADGTREGAAPGR